MAHPAPAPTDAPTELELDLLVAAVRAEHAALTSVLEDYTYWRVPVHPTVRASGLCQCHFPAYYDDLGEGELALAAVFAPAVHTGALTLTGYGYVVLELLGRQSTPGSTFVIDQQLDAIRASMPADYPRQYPAHFAKAD